MRAASGSPALSLRGVSKHFGGVRALVDVDLTVADGEVHGLLGENGSGKSTLIKVLAGFHAPDAGMLEVHGRPVDLPLAPGRFRELGMSFVHQDLALVTSLTVVENLRAGMIVRSRMQPYISWAAERRLARKVFARYGVQIDPSTTVADLRPVERALLAIVRAMEELRELHDTAGLLVLDEPTVFLPRADTEHLFALVREITGVGGSVLFVSHDLDEVREITDRVTVLRDGHVVGTTDTAATTTDQLVEMIIGRPLESFVTHRDGPVGVTVRASVRNLSGTGVRDVTFDLHEGEVLGLTGLAGSGFEGVPYLMYGAWPAESGELVAADGVPHSLTAMRPDRAIAAGMVLIPADRQRDGAVGTLPVTDNMTLPDLTSYRIGWRLRRDRMRQRTAELMGEFDVRPAEPGYDYGALSGGNQQKALLAKWLQMGPRLILLHEPTQGVDIGARQQIFETIRAAAAAGASVVCASSDYEQLALICDRVLVFGRGAVGRELVGGQITKDRIAEQCYAAATDAREAA